MVGNSIMTDRNSRPASRQWGIPAASRALTSLWRFSVRQNAALITARTGLKCASQSLSNKTSDVKVCRKQITIGGDDNRRRWWDCSHRRWKARYRYPNGTWEITRTGEPREVRKGRGGRSRKTCPINAGTGTAVVGVEIRVNRNEKEHIFLTVWPDWTGMATIEWHRLDGNKSP